jgi:hypothetical protein
MMFIVLFWLYATYLLLVGSLDFVGYGFFLALLFLLRPYLMYMEKWRKRKCQ